MASYDASINLRLNAGAVERELNKLESRLNKLGETSIGAKTGASRAAEAFIPKKALSVIQRELDNIVNRTNTAEKAFARFVEGIGTAGLTGAGLEGVNETLKNLAVSTGNVQQGFAEMNEAARTAAQILIPGFKDIDNFSRVSAASVNSLQYKLQGLLDSSQGIREFVQNFFTLEGGAAGATAAVTLLAAVLEGQLSDSLYDIEQASTQALSGLAEDAAKGSSELQRLILATQGTVTEYERLKRIGEERLANVNVESEEARRATNTIVVAQELLNEALKEQNQLLEDANNLRATSKKRTSDQIDEVQRALSPTTQGQVSPSDPFGITDQQINETFNTRAALIENSIEKAANAELKARKEVAALEANFTRDNRQRAFDALKEEFDAKMAALKKVDDIKKQQFDLEIETFDKALAAREEINKATTQGLQTRKDVEDRIARIQKDYQQELGEIGSRQRLKDLQERQKIEDELFAKKIRQAEQEGRDWDKEYKRRENASKRSLEEEARRRKQFREDLALGAGFPLLTGAGPGGVLGGVAGAVAGGGGGGFGLQILFSALGSLIDRTVASIAQKANEIGTALNPLTLNVKELTKASGLAGTAIDKLINSLKGQISDSRLAQLAAEQLAVVIGDEGVAALREFGDASTRLGQELSKAFSAIAAAAAPLLTGIAKPVAKAVGRSRLLSRANEFGATDPQIAKLEKQRRSVASADTQKQLEIEEKLIKLIRDKEYEEQRVVDAKLAAISTGRKEIDILELQNRLKELGGDLLDEGVRSTTERIIRQEALNDIYEIGVKYANDDLTFAQYKIERKQIELRLQGKLLDIQNEINKLEEASADRAAREAERADRERKRKQKELARAQQATRNLEIEVGVTQNILDLNKLVTKATLEENDEKLRQLEINRVLIKLGGQRAKIQAEELSATDRQLKIQQAELEAAIEILDINTRSAVQQRDEAKERAESLKSVLGGLTNEIELIDAKLAGNREEVEIRQEVEELTANIANNTRQDAENVERLVRDLRERQKLEEAFNIKQQTRFAGAGLQAGFIGKAGQAFEQKLISGGTREEAANIAQLTQQMELAQLQATALENAVLGIGNAFATAMTTGVSELIAGTKSAQEVFADFLKNVGDALLQAATQMIATYIAIGIAKAFAGLGGTGSTSYSGTGGVGQGQLLAPVSTGGNANSLLSSFLTPRAGGGPVGRNGTYLVGEQGPELFTPNQAGRISSTSETRSLLGRSPVGNAPAMNFTFETTNIGGQEFVSREQLEAAMAVTRKQAANDGARKGMGMTLDKMQHSPATRRRVGIS